MLFDYHVHVTGAILRSYKRDLIENKLKDSLDESGVNGFLGIVASGSLFSQPVYNNNSISLMLPDHSYCLH